jgi:nicotinamidase-related amidase
MKPHPRLDRSRAALLVIDMQEGFRGIIPDFDAVAQRIALAVRGARVLGVPVIVTEQYPKGLKRTASEILEALGSADAIEKTCFSACGAEGFRAELERLGPAQAIVCGIEAHICVTQTALDLLAREMDVFLPLDCIASRMTINREAAIARLSQAGAVPSSLEMFLFELMGRAGTAEFKEVQRLIL